MHSTSTATLFMFYNYISKRFPYSAVWKEYEPVSSQNDFMIKLEILSQSLEYLYEDSTFDAGPFAHKQQRFCSEDAGLQCLALQGVIAIVAQSEKNDQDWNYCVHVQ